MVKPKVWKVLIIPWLHCCPTGFYGLLLLLLVRLVLLLRVVVLLGLPLMLGVLLRLMMWVLLGLLLLGLLLLGLLLLGLLTGLLLLGVLMTGLLLLLTGLLLLGLVLWHLVVWMLEGLTWRRLLLEGSCLEGSCLEGSCLEGSCLEGSCLEVLVEERIHGGLLLRARCSRKWCSSLRLVLLLPGILPPSVLPPVFPHELEQVQMEVIQEFVFQLQGIHEDHMASVLHLLMVVVGVGPQEGMHLLLVRNRLLQETQDIGEEGILTGMGGPLPTPWSSSRRRWAAAASWLWLLLRQVHCIHTAGLAWLAGTWLEGLAPDGRQLLATFTDDVVPQEAVPLHDPAVSGIHILLAGPGRLLLGELAKLCPHCPPMIGDGQWWQAHPSGCLLHDPIFPVPVLKVASDGLVIELRAVSVDVSQEFHLVLGDRISAAGPLPGFQRSCSRGVTVSVFLWRRCSWRSLPGLLLGWSLALALALAWWWRL